MNTGRRGQVTLFIILGIVVFSGILAFIFWVKPIMDSSRSVSMNFDACVSHTVSEKVSDLAITGGFKKPEFGVIYKGQRIPYFIYTSQNDETGTTQVPFPEKKFEEELLPLVYDGINICYKNSLTKLQNLGYDVKKGEIEVYLTILPEKIEVLINAPTTIEGRQFEEIIIPVQSDIYGILSMANLIMNDELEIKRSNYYPSVDISSQLMSIYQDYIITSLYRTDSTKIYSIKNTNYDIEYKFAVRSQVMGIPGDSQDL